VKPDVPVALQKLSMSLLLEVGPAIGVDYLQRGTGIAAIMLQMAAEEWDRAAAWRAEENAALRSLFRDAESAVTDAGLRARLREAAAGADADLRISALEQANRPLRALVVELHAHLETLAPPRPAASRPPSGRSCGARPSAAPCPSPPSEPGGAGQGAPRPCRSGVKGGLSMPQLAALSLAFAVCFAFAAAPARAGDPSRDLDEVDSHVVRDLDEAATAEPRDVDEARSDEPADPDVVDARDLDAAETGRAGDVDENLGGAKSLEEADQAPEWTPPPCETLAFEIGGPDGDDAGAWASELGKAREQVGASRARLEKADAEYTYARNRQRPRGEALAKIVAGRDAARIEYATARCRFPELVEKARRSGVSPEVWRSYPASIE
jgi:hypothetical protein